MRAIFAIALFGLPAACADETLTGYANPEAVYVLEEIDGATFAARATIQFNEPGRIAGEAPCNRYSGAQDAPYPWFKPGPLAVTKRACPDLAAEGAFLEALSAMRLAEVSGPVLILSTESGREMVFRAE